MDLTAVSGMAAAVFRSEGDLIPLLQRTQAHYGYLPEPVVTEIARVTGVPAARIHGVITFYAQFSTTPAGRHKVFVCQGTACHVRGAHEVLRAVEKELGISTGQTTQDLDFSLETVACLGACSFSPVMTVDGQYFARMKASRVSTVLGEFNGQPAGAGEES